MNGRTRNGGRQAAKPRRPRASRRPSEVPRTLATMASADVQRASGFGKVYTITRSSAFTSLATAAADQGYTFNYTLNANFPSVTDVSGLFDLYRVLKLELVIQWTNVGVTSQPPSMFIAQDWDGIASTPASADVLTQRAAMKLVCFDVTHRVHTHVVERPAILLATAAIPAASSVIRRCPWIDLASLSETHFGPIAWINQYNSAVASGTLQYMWRATVQFRCLR